MATRHVATIRAAGGDYNDLATWDADLGANSTPPLISGNLVSQDAIAVAQVYNDWPGGMPCDGVEIRGDQWTADATHYASVEAAPGEGHGGDPSTGAALRSDSTTYGSIRAVRMYLEISDLRILAGAGGVTAVAFFQDNAAQYTKINRCIIDGHTSTLNGDLGNVAPAGFVYARSTLFLNGYRTAVLGSQTDRFVFENCGAAHYSSFAYIRSKTVGCWGYDNNTDFYLSAPGPGSDFNCSEDATAPGTTFIRNYGAANEFTNPVGDDFNLLETSQFREWSPNLYNDPDFLTDIKGDNWPAAGNWDAGPYHYVSGGAVAPTLSNIQATLIGDAVVTPQVTVTF